MAIVLSTQVRTALGEAVRQRAAAEGVTISTLLRRELERYLRDAPELGDDVDEKRTGHTDLERRRRRAPLFDLAPLRAEVHIDGDEHAPSIARALRRLAFMLENVPDDFEAPAR